VESPTSVRIAPLLTVEQKVDKSLREQAFQINSEIFKKENPLPSPDDKDRVQKSPGIRGYLARWKMLRLEDKHKSLDHAERYFKGQPHDRQSAGWGIDIAMDEANKRMAQTREDPDDAAAAEKDFALLFRARLGLN